MWVKVDVRPWKFERDTIPTVPGNYAFVKGGRVVYVGQTTNLRVRLSRYWPRFSHNNEWCCDPRVEGATVKYSVSRRYGDWLMRELRLIRRLRPVHNIAQPRERRA